jgi:alkylresorcinol/alkylpyrone synthase
MPKILAVGTAVTPYSVKQEEAQTFARECFAPSFPQIERYMSIFDHASIHNRYISQPISWYKQQHPFTEKNRIYVETAIELGEKAIRTCLDKQGWTPEDIDHLVFVSTTGIATPSMDARLINRLSMKSDVKRTPVWGLGCAGGVAGLSKAYEFAKANPSEKILLLAVECCSLTFCPLDHSKSNLVATSLFADGAAAVLICGDQVLLPDGTFPEITGAQSFLWPDTEEVMGWDLTGDGLKVIFSRSIPELVLKKVKPVVQRFLDEAGVPLSQIDVFLTHPGGKKVLEAYQKALNLPPGSLNGAFEILAGYGNMSSATVLFLLERELMQTHPAGSYGLMAAMGPGFSLELSLLHWDKEG